MPTKTRFGPHLTELFPYEALVEAINNGHVRVQVHPNLPLRILNYTERCQFERAWTTVTRQCRGLIVDDDGTVVARPFVKFFGYGEPETFGLPMREPVEVTDKADGSLGIMYPTGDLSRPWAIATRGSFTSEQAVHATILLRQRYPDFEPPDGMTVLFEIVYPVNRIVLDYGETDDLILLGAVDRATGKTVSAGWVSGWCGPMVDEFTSYATLADALAAEPRPNAEGLVVHFPRTGQRVKIKQADYVALHRILTQTTARTVWEFLAVNACKNLIDPKTPKHWGSRLRIDPARAAEILAIGDRWLDTLLDGVPDEFHAWLRDQIDGINAAVDALAEELDATLAGLVTEHGTDRKTLAKAIGKRPFFGELFLLLDGRDITTNLWVAVYPDADRPFAAQSEDVA